jgi:hypothetical protein
VEALDTLRYGLGRDREVVDTIGWKSSCGFDLLQALFEPAKAVGRVETRQIIESGGELVPTFLVQFEP